MERFDWESADRSLRLKWLREQVANRASISRLGVAAGVTRNVIVGYMRRNGIESLNSATGGRNKTTKEKAGQRKPGTGTREESKARKAAIADDLRRLVRVGEICERYTVSRQYVYLVAKQANVPIGEGVLKRARRETGDMSAIFGRAPTPVFDAPRREHGRAPWIAPPGAVPEQDRYGARTCQWIDGDPKTEEHSYCRARRYPNKPYCGVHCADAYVARPGEAA